MEMAKAETKVTLSDGREVFVKDLTLELAKMIPKDGKKNEAGEFTSITLKKALVLEKEHSWIERHVFQRTDMEVPVIGDLTLPKDEAGLKEIFAMSDVLDYVVESARVDFDANLASGNVVIPLDKKAMAIMKKMSKGEAITDEEKSVMLQWHLSKFGPQGTPEKVAETKASLKAHGFGGKK